MPEKKQNNKESDEDNKEVFESGKGIDIGTAFIKCAVRQGDEIVFSSQRNAFFEVEQTDYSRGIMDDHKVKYILRKDKLYVVGDDALEFANIFRQEARRPLSKGVISPTEKEALPMIQLLIKSVIGEAQPKGELVYYSVPGEPLDADFDVIYHESILKEFLKQLGYKPKVVNEAYAIILSELAAEDFTGLGLSFGAGMVNACLSYRSIPIFKFSVAKSGDWIDQHVSKVVNETAGRVAKIKETSLNLNLPANNSQIESALSIYYNHLIEYVIENITQELNKQDKLPSIEKPISVVLAGGTASPTGFVNRFKDVLEDSDFPLKIGDVRMASQPLRAVAKGALIAAKADRSDKK